MSILRKGAIFFLLLTASGIFAYWEWTPKTGKWINPKYAVKDTAKEQFELAEKYKEEGALEKAIREYEKLLKHYPDSEYAAQSCFCLAEVYQSTGDIRESFGYYQKIVDNYPQSPLVLEAVKRQSVMAEEQLKKNSIKFIGRQEEKGDMLAKVVESHPYGEETPEKAMQLGSFYLEIKEFDKARDVFNGMVMRYTNPSVIEEAQFYLIKTEFLSTPEVSTDIKQYQEVKNRIDAFLLLYPDSSYGNEITSIRNQLSEREAKQYYEIASFYERTGKKDSAKHYYRILVDNYPETDYGKTAAKKLRVSD